MSWVLDHFLRSALVLLAFRSKSYLFSIQGPWRRIVKLFLSHFIHIFLSTVTFWCFIWTSFFCGLRCFTFIAFWTSFWFWVWCVSIIANELPLCFIVLIFSVFTLNLFSNRWYRLWKQFAIWRVFILICECFSIPFLSILKFRTFCITLIRRHLSIIYAMYTHSWLWIILWAIVFVVFSISFYYCTDCIYLLTRSIIRRQVISYAAFAILFPQLAELKARLLSLINC